MIGADAIIKCLTQEKVEYVFGYPGVAIAPFYNSILETDIQTILVRQEQNAAHAASGYARSTGKTGVVAVTSGPGAENLITGIATAFADSIPMVCITGQVDSIQMGSDVFQEADIAGACESFVKYSYIIRDVNEIPRIMKEAFFIASTGRKGPVLIDIPYDVQKAEIKKFSYPDEVKMRTYKPTVSGHAVQIKKVITELKRAKRPIMCVGGGVVLSDAVDEVRTFVEKHKIPVVSTMMGLSVMPTQHALFYGMVGNNGKPYGNHAMNNADMIIMVGARVADRSISQPDLITENKILVHIDVDPAEIGKNAGPTIPLVGDIKHVVKAFLAEDFDADYTDWLDSLNKERTTYENGKDEKIRADIEAKIQRENTGAGKTGVNPAAFIKTLSLAMDDNAVYVADVGQNQLWSCANVVIRDGRFFTSGGMGTMGYAVPAAMGCKLGKNQKQVVAVCGDGGFQMSMMELATMKQYGILAKVVILKNGWLGLVRQHQHLAYQDRFSVTDLGDYPHLEPLSRAYDMNYYKIDSCSGMRDVIDAFLSDKESAILEVAVAPEELC